MGEPLERRPPRNAMIRPSNFRLFQCPECSLIFGTDREAVQHARECCPDSWPWEPVVPEWSRLRPEPPPKR
jgi:hypothetical protein